MEIRKFVVCLNIFFLIAPLIRGEELISSAVLLDDLDSGVAPSNNGTNFTDADANTSISISADMTTNETVKNSNRSISEIEVINISAVEEDILSNEKKDELNDLQYGGNFENITKTINENDLVDLPETIDSGEIEETEWIEEDANIKDDVDIPPFVQAMTDVSAEEVKYLFQGQTGLVVAALLIVLLASGYIGFIVWRQFIKKRYGNGERLVNEDDMIDPNDMKHFSL